MDRIQKVFKREYILKLLLIRYDFIQIPSQFKSEKGQQPET